MADPTFDETPSAGQTGMLTDLGNAYRFIDQWLNATTGFWYNPTTISTKVQADAAANPVPLSWRVVSTSTYTVVDADVDQALDCTVACTITVPSTLTKHSVITVRKRTGTAGTNDVTIVAGSNVRIDFPTGKTKITAQNGQAAIIFLGSNYYGDGLQAYTCTGVDA